VLPSTRKGVSAPFRDTTARKDYAGTALRIRFRMRTRLAAYADGATLDQAKKRVSDYLMSKVRGQV